MRLLAWGGLAIALTLWGAFGFLLYNLSGERAELARARDAAREEGLRGESAARLRATIQDSEAERAALESVVRVPILEAVEAIESAGKKAGAAEVSIGNASPSAGMPAGVMAVSVVVNARGSFAALVRMLNVLETLPIPSTLEQFELEKVDSSWRLTARLRLIVASSTL
ncbi:hypothetical protein A3A38_02570 [Candidatus Kaiserbacteria bacterium RIFCSPLOWO2_01_FULL_53_17]|uniref:Type 4a pilus biogenesis protein PilO n=1 Tax=Candidatus Kaiserbacteria bacterium RIFCSPLOWO2_01_FULL_53_17 TaxID=1798511 RepID=A0A1F6EGQ2_9BACT|nr:MAG: hypothetical protein A3A38_02570 [Candidatus Kaiserbacteria bacterium RIFCSPLOWO2_01_FULL_53_17]